MSPPTVCCRHFATVRLPFTRGRICASCIHIGLFLPLLVFSTSRHIPAALLFRGPRNLVVCCFVDGRIVDPPWLSPWPCSSTRRATQRTPPSFGTPRYVVESTSFWLSICIPDLALPMTSLFFRQKVNFFIPTHSSGTESLQICHDRASRRGIFNELVTIAPPFQPSRISTSPAPLRAVWFRLSPLPLRLGLPASTSAPLLCFPWTRHLAYTETYPSYSCLRHLAPLLARLARCGCCVLR